MKNKFLQLFVSAALVLSTYIGYSQVWSPVGSVAFSPGQVALTSMAVGKNDTPYIAYQDMINNDAVSVMKYNGSSWVNVGPPGFSHTVTNWAGNESSLILKIDTAGKPWIFFQDSVTPPFSVMTYIGGNWVYVDSAGIAVTQSQPGILSMDLDTGGTPYIAFVDYNHTYGASVMKHTDTGWAYVGAQNFTPGSCDFLSLTLDKTGTPWLAFNDGSVSGNISVQKFNGTNWVLQGAEGFSNAQYGVAGTSLAFDNNNNAYVAYQDGGNSNEAVVRKFNGASWIPVGDTDFSQSGASYIDLKISSGGIPVVSYSDQNDSYHATVQYFNGYSWVSLGSPDFSSSEADWVSLALSKSGVPYVCFEDYGNGHTASVYSYGIAVPTGIGDINNNIATLNVYPNPNNGTFSVKVQTTEACEMNLAIYDLVGRQVWSTGAVSINGGYYTNIHSGDLSTGTYFLQVKTNNGVQTQKLEIVR